MQEPQVSKGCKGLNLRHVNSGVPIDAGVEPKTMPLAVIGRHGVRLGVEKIDISCGCWTSSRKLGKKQKHSLPGSGRKLYCLQEGEGI